MFGIERIVGAGFTKIVIFFCPLTVRTPQELHRENVSVRDSVNEFERKGNVN